LRQWRHGELKRPDLCRPGWVGGERETWVAGGIWATHEALPRRPGPPAGDLVRGLAPSESLRTGIGRDREGSPHFPIGVRGSSGGPPGGSGSGREESPLGAHGRASSRQRPAQVRPLQPPLLRCRSGRGQAPPYIRSRFRAFSARVLSRPRSDLSLARERKSSYADFASAVFPIRSS